MNAEQIATEYTVLRGIVGSKALGTNVSDQDDTDEMGVCIEPPSVALGLDNFEHYIYRTQPEGVRSGPGDLDLTIYSLRKFIRLAAQGNPSILILLYLPDDFYTVSVEPWARYLREYVPDMFVSKEAGKRFLGFLRSQKAKLNGERSPCVSRPELVERYGFDTKFAYHAVRLGLQGIEYLTDKKLTMPMRDAEFIRSIRTGGFTLQQVLAMIDDVESKLSELVDKCNLVVDTRTVSDWMQVMHVNYWQENEMI